jgi:hypothetical protein
VVNGSARWSARFAGMMRTCRPAILYHYAIAMIIGLVVLLTLFVRADAIGEEMNPEMPARGSLLNFPG